MSKQVPWNIVFLEEFIRIGALSEDEEMIMRTRVAGWTRTRQSVELCMSVGKIDKIIKRLKVKYDNAQKYSAILPPRRFSAEETYLDSH